MSPINAGSMEEKEEGRGKSNTRQTGMEEEEEEGKKRKCIGSGGKKMRRDDDPEKDVS